MTGLALVLSSLLWTGPAGAASDTLKEQRSVELSTPPAKVWGMIENFGDLTWVPVVKSSSATLGNTVGSVRTLDLGGPKLVEKLTRYDPDAHSYSYAILDSAANRKTLPVSGYTSTIQVLPGKDNGSKVVWSGTFHRADQGAHPPPGEDDATAKKAVGGVYQAGMDALKAKLQGS